MILNYQIELISTHGVISVLLKENVNLLFDIWYITNSHISYFISNWMFQVDLEDIKIRYKSLYKQPLEQDIKSECSGDYKKILLAIIGST